MLPDRGARTRGKEMCWPPGCLPGGSASVSGSAHVECGDRAGGPESVGSLPSWLWNLSWWITTAGTGTFRRDANDIPSQDFGIPQAFVTGGRESKKNRESCRDWPVDSRGVSRNRNTIGTNGPDQRDNSREMRRRVSPFRRCVRRPRVSRQPLLPVVFAPRLMLPARVLPPAAGH